MDGWHKLINYGIVVHGCIDGATRLPVFMWASNNNRSQTVEKLFKSAVQKFSKPPPPATMRRIQLDGVMSWEILIWLPGLTKSTILLVVLT